MDVWPDPSGCTMNSSSDALASPKSSLTYCICFTCRLEEDDETLAEIEALVKTVASGQSVDIPTDLTPRKLRNRLLGFEDADGAAMVLRCTAIPGGVRVTCASKCAGLGANFN